MEKKRLNALMAKRGLCSRREADELIKKGWVYVNNERITVLGTKCDPAAKIELTQKGRSKEASKVTILIHKPPGLVSSQPEDGYRAAVELVTTENQIFNAGGEKFQSKNLVGLAPAGRLDIDSCGLLIMTQQGIVAQHLIGPGSDVEKEYLVKVHKNISEEDIKPLAEGLSLDGQKLRPAQIKKMGPNFFKIILKQGRKRQIRRMCELIGLRVTWLKRIRIGSVRLGNLKEGHWRFLKPDEKF